MAQYKEESYIVVFAAEVAATGEWTQEVYPFTNTSEGTADDLSAEKYFDLLHTYWNDTTYDYIAVNRIRVLDNVCVEAKFKDSRLDPEPEVEPEP